MAIEYKVIKRKVIGGVDKGKEKFYASSNITGKTTLEDLTQDIEQSSTVNGADIRAVLYGLFESVPKHLKSGNSVELTGIGTFRISISSDGEETADKVTAKSIKDPKILFTPDKKFKQVLDNLNYKKK